MRRLAYLVHEPIIYQAPLLRKLAQESQIDLTVFFARNDSARSYEAGFGSPITWDTPLLDGYKHEFLPVVGRHDKIGFVRPLNYGLIRRFRKERFDALWVHGYMRPNHWLAMSIARRLGMKVMVRDEATEISKRRGPTRRLLKRAFFAWLSRVANCFLAIGSRNREYYLRQGVREEQMFLVPYAVDNSFFQSRVEACRYRREEFRAALGLSKGRPIILYVGKMTPRKRPNDLLEAYLRLPKSVENEPHPYLLLVGDGELRPDLERRAAQMRSSSIRFPGFRNQSELPAFYDLCDVFVMPSTFEPWGLVVNEAMNASRPIIASDQVGCVPDLVRNGVNGLIFKAGDVADLSRALGEVLADPERREEMGRKSSEIINGWSFEEDLRGIHSALEL